MGETTKPPFSGRTQDFYIENLKGKNPREGLLLNFTLEIPWSRRGLRSVTGEKATSFSLEFKRTSAQDFGRQDAEWDKGKETSEHG